MPKYLEWLKEQLQKPDFILVVISEQSESNLNIQIELASELTVNVLFKCYVFIYDVLGYPQEAETHTIDLVMNKFTPSLSHFNVSEFNRSEKKTNKNPTIWKLSAFINKNGVERGGGWFSDKYCTSHFQTWINISYSSIFIVREHDMKNLWNAVSSPKNFFGRK